MKLATKSALHTLWQTAVASGGIGEALKSVTDHSVNVPGVEQGLFVAGAAVGGAALSLVKHGALTWLAGWRAKSARNDEVAKIMDEMVSEYQSKHLASPAVARANGIDAIVLPVYPPLVPAGDS